MKKIIILFILWVATLSFFYSSVHAEQTHKACLKYYWKWDRDYDNYCNNVTQLDPFTSCQVYNPTKKWINLLKVDMIPFIPMPIWKAKEDLEKIQAWEEVEEEEIDNENYYWNHIEKLWIFSYKFIWVMPLERAKSVYTETQNSIYNCAILNAKKKIWEKILQLMENDKSSNIITKMQTVNESVNQEISKRECNIPTKDMENSYKKILLENMTYHYCNYRFYLDYLSSFQRDNIFDVQTSAKWKRPNSDQTNTDMVSRYITKQVTTIDDESNHAKQVYNTAFASYIEFENTYWQHILLTFIYDDYVQIRNNLALLLNPISQLAYKIPQAMCLSWCN